MGKLLDDIQNVVPEATKALKELFSETGPEGGNPTIGRVIESVKEVSKDSPISVLSASLGFLGICGVCAFYNMKLRHSARSPAMDYGIQLQPSTDEPFFRQF